MKMIEITINGESRNFAEGTTVAAALLSKGLSRFRTSVSNQPRVAFCGMGVCFECRVTIDGVLHERSCQTPIIEGMNIETDGKD